MTGPESGISRPTQRMLSAVGAIWGNRFLNIVLNLMLTPLLFGGLGRAELGLWITIQSAIGILALLDLGLTSTLPRRFAFLRGETDIGKKHLDDPEAIGRVQDLIVTGNRLYALRMVGTLIAGAALGGIALRGGLKLEPALAEKALIAWVAVVLGQTLQLWGAAWSASLGGFGLVAWQIGISSAVTSFGLLAQIAVVSAGCGIIGLACITAPLPIITRQVLVWTMRRLHPEIDVRRGRWDGGIARSMIRPSLAAWFTSVGAFATLRLDNYFIAAYAGLESIGPFFAAMQVYNSIVFIALAVTPGSSPLLSQLWAKGERTRFANVSGKVVTIALMIAVAGAATLIATAESLFSVWLGPNSFPGNVVIVLVAARISLDTMQAVLLGVARSTEFEVFARLSLAAAGLNIVFCFLLAPHFGVVGVLTSNLLAQGATLHSMGAFRSVQRGGRGFATAVARAGFVSVPVGLASGFVAVGLLKLMQPGLLSVLAAISAAGLVLMCGVLTFALDRWDRAAVSKLLLGLVMQLGRGARQILVRTT